MAYIVVGYRTKLHNSKLLGIKPCGSCKKFSEQYLARSWFTINLFWVLPIFGFPTGRYLRCKNCNSGYKLTREQWNELKLAAADMPKKKDYRRAYEALKALVASASPEDLNVDTIYSRVMSTVECADEGRHIRELVVTYLQNSQAAAAVLNPEQPAEEITAAPAAEALPEATEEAQPEVIAEAVEAVQPEVIAEAVEEAPAEAAPAASRSTAPNYAAPNYTKAAAPAAPIQGSAAAPYIAAAPQQHSGLRERSKARFLWLIPAILLLPVAFICFISIFVLFAEPDPDMLVNIICTIIFLIPGALDILFFVLAFKKYKKY